MQKHLIVVAGILVLATTSAPALAKWGCGNLGIGGQGWTWNFATRTQAAKGAFDECIRAGGSNCRHLGCSENVYTEAHAKAIWPPRYSPDKVRCRDGNC
jgi:hypothetical protein